MKSLGIILKYVLFIAAFNYAYSTSHISNTLPELNSSSHTNKETIPENTTSICSFNKDQASAFFIKIKALIKANDKAGLSKLMHYPLRINEDRKYFIINNRKDFLARYNAIITLKVKEWFLMDNGDFFCNYQGGMFAGGLAWYDLYDGELKIFAINKPK